MAVTMKLEGFEATRRAFVNAPELVRAGVSQAVATSVYAVEQRVRANIWTGAGTLKRFLGSRLPGPRGLSGGVGFTDDKTTFYWRFQEFGTRYLPARPVFRPAAEAETATFIERVRAIGPRLEREL
jgi:HK97 gp10 family phage protein